MNKFGGFLCALGGAIVIAGYFVKSLDAYYPSLVGGGLVLIVGLYFLFNRSYY